MRPIRLLYLLALWLMIMILAGCRNNNPLNVGNEVDAFVGWVEPDIDAYVIAFRLSDALIIDSTYAGEIQYKLNLARSLDTQLDSIHPMPSFELGTILLGISEELYCSFDGTTCRFNANPVDSLLDLYQPISGRKLNPISSYCIVLKFAFNYNTPILAEKFEGIPGIGYSNANWYGILACGLPYDVWIKVLESIFKFTFWIKNDDLDIIHYWLIEVEGDSSKVIKEWEESIR